MPDHLQVGVFDWPSFAVGRHFYPEDLPAEWRLNYYANAFESACLPLSALPPPGDEREEWLDSLPPGFRLSLLQDEAGTVPAPDELGAADPGWLVDGAAVEGWLPAASESLLWRPGDARFAPVVLLPRADSLAQTRQWIEAWIALSKNPDAADTVWVEAAAVTPGQLEALRQMVELMGL